MALLNLAIYTSHRRTSCEDGAVVRGPALNCLHIEVHVTVGARNESILGLQGAFQFQFNRWRHAVTTRPAGLHFLRLRSERQV